MSETSEAAASSLLLHEVHIWHMSLGGRLRVSPVDQACLSKVELDRLRRFRNPLHAQGYLVTRITLRRLLAYYLGIAPADVTFRCTEHGKPELPPLPGLPSLCFNLSHSGNRILIAVSRGFRVGVDVERIDPSIDIQALAGHLLNTAEAGRFRALMPPAQINEFFRYWTHKEALLKAKGLGIGGGLNRIGLTWPEEGGAILEFDLTDPELQEPWFLTSLDIGPGYAAALAVELTDPTVVVRTLDATPDIDTYRC